MWADSSDSTKHSGGGAQRLAVHHLVSWSHCLPRLDRVNMRTTALVTGKKDEADLREPEIVSRFVSRLLTAMRQPEAPCSRRDLWRCRRAEQTEKLCGFTDNTRVAASERGRSRTRCSKTSERGRRTQRDHGCQSQRVISQPWSCGSELRKAVRCARNLLVYYCAVWDLHLCESLVWYLYCSE